jgi:hypothetical protein
MDKSNAILVPAKYIIEVLTLARQSMTAIDPQNTGQPPGSTRSRTKLNLEMRPVPPTGQKLKVNLRVQSPGGREGR